MTTWLATFHGRRQGSGVSRVPSITRVVRVAIAASRVQASTPYAASQTNTPSQPEPSATIACSSCWVAVPPGSTTPNFMLWLREFGLAVCAAPRTVVRPLFRDAARITPVRRTTPGLLAIAAATSILAGCALPGTSTSPTAATTPEHIDRPDRDPVPDADADSERLHEHERARHLEPDPARGADPGGPGRAKATSRR